MMFERSDEEDKGIPHMKKLFTVLATVFLLAGAYSYARAECTIATKEVAQEQIVSPMQHRMLSDNEVAALIASKGTPPNALEGVPIEMELIYTDELAGVNLYQGGCFINRLGPAPKQVIYNLLGIVEG